MLESEKKSHIFCVVVGIFAVGQQEREGGVQPPI